MTKECKGCDQIKDQEEFPFQNKKRRIRYYRCRSCVHDKFVANRERIIPQIHDANKRRKLDHRRKLYEYLLVHPCIECGEARVECLDFDHIDPTEKLMAISQMPRYNYSWQKIEAEIVKCAVRCANCHRVRTAQQHNWYKEFLAV